MSTGAVVPGGSMDGVVDAPGAGLACATATAPPGCAARGASGAGSAFAMVTAPPGCAARGASGAGSAFAMVTASWPGAGESIVDVGEDVAPGSPAASSRRARESRSGDASGETLFPTAPADCRERPGTPSGSAGEPGSTRSTTTVSSAAGAGWTGPTSSMTPPVATTSAEPTTTPIISRRRPGIPGLR